MADATNKRCPQCGKRPADRRLVQCPECRVPFEYEEAGTVELTPAQMAAITRHVFSSWKLWVVLLILAAGVFAGIRATIENKTKQIEQTLAQSNAAQINAATTDYSERVKEQIAAEFKQPRIQAAIEQAATSKVNEVLTNEVWASLEVLRENVREATTKLASATNDLAQLAVNVKAAQHTVGQLSGAGDAPLLTLVDQSVTRRGTNFVLTMFLRPTNDKPLGGVELVAGTYRRTARIINFTARNVDQSEPATINADGDAGSLKFTVTKVDAPITVEMELSAATIVRVVSDSLDQDLTLQVAVEQMRMPIAGR